MIGSLGGCSAARKKAAVLTDEGKKSQSSIASAVGRWVGLGCRQAVASGRQAHGRYSTSDAQNLHAPSDNI